MSRDPGEKIKKKKSQKFYRGSVDMPEREGDNIGRNFLSHQTYLFQQNAKWKRHVNKISLKIHKKQIRYRKNESVI